MRINVSGLLIGPALLAATFLCSTSAQAVDLEVFEFNDASGTELMNAANSINGANLWFSPNSGAGMVPSTTESGSFRVIKDFEQLNSNYLQIANVTSGKAFIVVDMANWNFVQDDPADPAEQIRFAFLDEDSGTSGNVITAQVQIGRSDTEGIELTGTAIGTAGAASIANAAPLAITQTDPFKLVLELDKDSDSFKVFYKDGSNPTQVLGLGAVSRVRDGNSIRFAVNNNFGTGNFPPTIIDEQFNIDRFAVTTTNPLTDLISLTVNRNTGAMTLQNTSGAAISGIESISILSDVGSLDSTQWKSVSNNYDGNSGGAIDNNDNWGIDTTTRYELSESMLGGGPGDGGGLTIGQSVDLDISPAMAPGPWLQSPYEDVRMVLTLAGGATRTVDVSFTGNGGAKWAVGDLDFDTDIDIDDWNIFIDGNEEDLSSYSLAEAYQHGDLDKDGINSVLDFGIFKDAYDSFNGGGAFARMLAGVPEPSSMTLALLATLGLTAVRRRKAQQPGGEILTHDQSCNHTGMPQEVQGNTMNRSALHFGLLPLAVVLVLTSIARPARATILEEFLFNDANGTLLEEAENNVNASHFFDSDADTSTVATNGLGQLNASLKSNLEVGFNYVDLHPGVTTPLTTGRYWGVMELTWDFQSTFDPADHEEIRYTIINNDPRGTFVTAEWTIERTGETELMMFGDANGTGSSDTLGVVINSGSVTQTDKFIAVVDADLDNDVYEILYSNNAGTSFQSAGNGTLDPARGIESLRLVLNNDLSNDNVLIDRFYLTDDNPTTPIDKLLLQVNTDNGEISILNDTTSTFDIDWYRITSDDDSLSFNDWESLSDQHVDEVLGLGWDEAGGSNDGKLSESFLTGSTVIEPEDPALSLGNAFKYLTGTLEGLTFEYRDAMSGNVFTGNIMEVMGGGGLLGDYNGDDVIDGADYTTWRDALTAGSSSLLNDPTPGSVTEADFLYWRDHYGETAGSGAGASSAAVPEPSSLLLVLCGILSAFRLTLPNRGKR